MDENTQAKFEAKLKELLAIAKKKKNVLEYQEISDFFKDMPLETEQFEKILDFLKIMRLQRRIRIIIGRLEAFLLMAILV